MKLIVGLGNPGEEFKKTRHNAGFLVLDGLVVAFGEGKEVGVWRFREELRSKIANCQLLPIAKLILAKPRTGMNASGEAVKKIVDQRGVGLDNLLLVHDDLDLLLDEFRLQRGRGAAGHKGVRSVIDALGSKEFFRLRVGIGKPPQGTTTEDYVLGNFTSDERKVIDELVEKELVGMVREWVNS